MTDSVGANRNVYAPIGLWKELEDAMKEYEKRTGKRMSFNAFIAEVLKRGVLVLKEELKRP